MVYFHSETHPTLQWKSEACKKSWWAGRSLHYRFEVDLLHSLCSINPLSENSKTASARLSVELSLSVPFPHLGVAHHLWPGSDLPSVALDQLIPFERRESVERHLTSHSLKASRFNE